MGCPARRSRAALSACACLLALLALAPAASALSIAGATVTVNPPSSGALPLPGVTVSVAPPVGQLPVVGAPPTTTVSANLPNLPTVTVTPAPVAPPAPAPTAPPAGPLQLLQNVAAPVTGSRSTTGAPPPATQTGTAAPHGDGSTATSSTAVAGTHSGGAIQPGSSSAAARAGTPAAAAVRSSNRRGTGPRGQAASVAAAGAIPLIGTARLANAAPVPSRPAGGDPVVVRDIRTIVGVIPTPVKALIGALLLIAIWFAARSRVAAVRARRLERQRHDLLGEIGLLQRALLPEVPDSLPGIDVSVAYRPAEGLAAGGDFYDVFALGESRTAFIVGDVMGHGRDALAVTALMRYSLRAYLNAGLEPRLALKVAGNALDGDPGGELTTVIVAVHDAKSGELTYAAAGHEQPIVLAPDADEPVTVCSAPPIGGFMETGQRQTRLSLPPGSRVCFFTDGLVEARCGDGMLGRGRLTEALRELAPDAAAEALVDRVVRRAELTPDDMAACVVRFESGTTEPGTRLRIEELEVQPGEVQAQRVETFLAACGVGPVDALAALETSRGLLAAGGGALVRVTIEAGVGRATVEPPAAGPLTIPPLDEARRSARTSVAA